MSYLLTGVHEQNEIAHVMAYSSCVGDYANQNECAASLTGWTSFIYKIVEDILIKSVNVCIFFHFVIIITFNSFAFNLWDLVNVIVSVLFMTTAFMHKSLLINQSFTFRLFPPCRDIAVVLFWRQHNCGYIIYTFTSRPICMSKCNTGTFSGNIATRPFSNVGLYQWLKI
jgi:hypothetical protein